MIDDWIFDKILEQEAEYAQNSMTASQYSDTILVCILKDNLDLIPANSYKDLVINILEASEKYKLSKKQRNVLNKCYTYNFIDYSLSVDKEKEYKELEKKKTFLDNC